MKLKINVKEEHIINGTCNNGSCCAIALAVNDLFPAYVANGFIKSDNYGEIISYLDDNIDRKIRTFDSFNGKPMNDKDLTYEPIIGKDRLEYLKPFSFEIEILPKALDCLFPNKHLDQIKDLVNNSLNCELV